MRWPCSTGWRREHRRVVVIGRSLGSGVAVQVASARPVARLILVTPYDSLEEIAAMNYPVFPVRWMMLDRFDSGRHAAKVTAPTLLIAAERDEVIPRASTDRLLGQSSARGWPGSASSAARITTSATAIPTTSACSPRHALSAALGRREAAPQPSARRRRNGHERLLGAPHPRIDARAARLAARRRRRRSAAAPRA